MLEKISKHELHNVQRAVPSGIETLLNIDARSLVTDIDLATCLEPRSAQRKFKAKFHVVKLAMQSIEFELTLKNYNGDIA